MTIGRFRAIKPQYPDRYRDTFPTSLTLSDIEYRVSDGHSQLLCNWE